MTCSGIRNGRREIGPISPGRPIARRAIDPPRGCVTLDVRPRVGDVAEYGWGRWAVGRGVSRGPDPTSPRVFDGITKFFLSVAWPSARPVLRGRVRTWR